MPIRILDAAIVGRIAAGEVVERPCSVSKELMENSLDAGATSITVEIKGGGIDSLRVTDNGCGIEPGQVRLAFENHATSKLTSAEQLGNIATLGFRGEALPSISSVAHVEMTTRARKQDAGVRLNIDGGQGMRVREIGCPEGTTVLVNDLFYNIPVRRTFLKKPGYEGGLVGDVVARMLVGNPGVSVRFVNNGKTVYHSFGDGKLRHAVFAVYGKETAEKMLELDVSEGGVRLYGLIGVGDCAKQTRAHQMFFINGRSVRCALLSRALERVCQGRVTIGMYPMCALNLVLPSGSVDVNVHPNKLEVRFRDEQALYASVEKLLGSAFAKESMLDAVGKQQLERQTTSTTVREIAITNPENDAIPQKTTEVLTVPEAPAKPEQTPSTAAFLGHERQMAIMRREAALQEAVPAPLPVAFFQETRQRGTQNALHLVEREKAEELHAPEQPVSRQEVKCAPEQISALEQVEEKTPEFRVIGVLFKTYILVEANDSLVLIDQHAAHERLRYEKYVRALDQGAASQRLLTPMILRVTSREMAAVMENKEALTQAGYEVEAFGDTDLRVMAVPLIMGRTDARPLLMETINALGGMKSMALDARREEIMQRACKGAVKAGDTLSESEISSLIADMLASGAPPTCPHGRPVARVLTRRELERMFKRIQS